MAEFFEVITPFVLLIFAVFTLAFQLAVFYYFVTNPHQNKIKKILRQTPEFWEVNDAVNFFKRTLEKSDKN
jgi:hypothetical protein